MNPSEPRQIENDSRHPVDFLESLPKGNKSTLEQVGLRATVVLYCIRPDFIGGQSLEEIGLWAGCTRQAVEHLVADFRYTLGWE